MLESADSCILGTGAIHAMRINYDSHTVLQQGFSAGWSGNIFPARNRWKRVHQDHCQWRRCWARRHLPSRGYDSRYTQAWHSNSRSNPCLFCLCKFRAIPSNWIEALLLAAVDDREVLGEPLAALRNLILGFQGTSGNIYVSAWRHIRHTHTHTISVQNISGALLLNASQICQCLFLNSCK